MLFAARNRSDCNRPVLNSPRFATTGAGRGGAGSYLAIHGRGTVRYAYLFGCIDGVSRPVVPTLSQSSRNSRGKSRLIRLNDLRNAISFRSGSPNLANLTTKFSRCASTKPVVSADRQGRGREASTGGTTFPVKGHLLHNTHSSQHEYRVEGKFHNGNAICGPRLSIST